MKRGQVSFPPPVATKMCWLVLVCTSGDAADWSRVTIVAGTNNEGGK
jgi:hypothetical protein